MYIFYFIVIYYFGYIKINIGVKEKTQVNVNNFNDYITDLKIFMDKVVLPESKYKKVFLFGHSMGGGISAKFLEEYPNYFNAAILSSPMLEINTGSVNKTMAKLIAKIMVYSNNKNKFVMGQGPYTCKYDTESAGTSSLARYDYFYNIEKDYPSLPRGGASYNWLLQAFKFSKSAIKNAYKATAPILLFQAENDTFVNSGGQNKFAEFAKNCTLIKIKNARHELYREKDEILFPYLEKVLDFYNKNL